MSSDAIGGVGAVGSSSASFNEPSLEADAKTDGGNVHGEIGGGEWDVGAYESQGQDRYGINANEKSVSGSVEQSLGNGVKSKTEASGPRADLKAEAGENGAGFKVGASAASASTSVGRSDPNRKDDSQTTVGGSAGGAGLPSGEVNFGDSDDDGYREFGFKFGFGLPGAGSVEFGHKGEIGISDKQFNKALDPEKNGVNQALDPNRNGVADAMDPEKNGTNKALDPNRNGVADAMDPEKNGTNKALDPNRNGAADAMDPEKNGTNKAMDPERNGVSDAFKKAFGG